ncbi:MAG: cytochrome c oxidase assembly protein [Betaproteobacteria bacterium]
MNTPLPDGPAATLASERRVANRALLTRLMVVAVGMFAFGYALVPFYDQICKAAGLNNLLQPAAVSNTQVDMHRTVRIEFDSNVRNLPWTFKPVTPISDVHPGQVQHIVYAVSNNTNRVITGQAIPSYGPQYAAQYFQKLECFCFTKQTLQPGEVRQMPVVYVIDPAVPDELKTITLSYTFFEVEGG